MLIIKNARLILSNRIENGGLAILNDRIVKIEVDDYFKNYTSDGNTVIDAENNYVLPGYVDIHCHGGCGSSFMDFTEYDFLKSLDFYENIGVTTVIPTSVACSEDEMIKFLQIYRKVANRKELYGIHFEGPYLSVEKAGAQNPDMCVWPRRQFVDMIVHEYPEIKRWTIAPERDEGYKICKLLNDSDIVVSAGHTNVLYNEMTEAFKQGYEHVTHLYSGMNTMMYIDGFRHAGAVEASLLNDNVTVELICDGIHLPYEIIELVYKIKGAKRIAIISDAMRATGCFCKKSILGNRNTGVPVVIEDNVAKLPDKSSLAGSITSLPSMVKNLLQNTDIPLVDIIKMATYTPSKIMKISDAIGELAINKKANILIADENLNVKKIIVDGKIKC